jgi:hypothetical protein
LVDFHGGQLEQLLRDEFADERRQVMADRELPNA